MLTNNNVLSRIRYTFDFSDSKMIEIFGLADYEVTRAQVSDWLKKDTDPEHRELSDKLLAIFLNGLINEKRGKREGAQVKPEELLNNNIILRKLKIALNYKDIDMLEVFELANMQISKHELSAFFRKPSQSQYRSCLDQFLRNFLQGLQIKYRNELKK